LIKNRYNAFLPANYFFLRDSKGVEVDCVQELADGLRFTEIKLSETLSYDLIKNIVSLSRLFKNTDNYVIYSGQEVSDFHNVRFVNWKKSANIMA
jgi:hypothetical protein